MAERAQAMRKRTGNKHRGWSQKLEKELEERHRRAHLTREERDMEDNAKPFGRRREGHCDAPGCFRDIHARRLCMMHYQQRRRANQNPT